MEDNNYAKTADSSRKLFLEYDQARIIETFGLTADERYIYLEFLKRKERLNRSSAIIEYLDSGIWKDVSFAEYMTVFDVLSRYEKPVLTGDMVPAAELLGSVYRAGVAEGWSDREAALLDGRFDDMKAVCGAMGRIEKSDCDLECAFDLFVSLPVRMRFFRADEEFPAEIRFLWDRCTLRHMHFETTQFCERFITDLIIKKIKTA